MKRKKLKLEDLGEETQEDTGMMSFYFVNVTYYLEFYFKIMLNVNMREPSKCGLTGVIIWYNEHNHNFIVFIYLKDPVLNARPGIMVLVLFHFS